MKKVHTKIVIDMISGEVLEDQFYSYDGDWARCDDDDNIADTLSPVGDQLERLVTQPEKGFLSFRTGTDLFGLPGELGEFGSGDEGLTVEQAPIAPNLDRDEEFQLNQQGFRTARVPTFNRSGKFVRRVTRIVPIPDAELENFIGANAAQTLRSNRQINLLSSQRTEAALRGDLDVSPAFEREAGERTQQTQLSVLRGAGLGSTSGSQQIALQEQTNALLRDAIRRGEITSGQAISLQQQQLGSNIQNQLLQNISSNRFRGAQLNLQQQGLNQELQIANLLAQQGRRAGQQELLGTVAGAAIPGLIKL
jgi:hypothetical protein